MKFAEVAVSVPMFPNKRFFDYEIPDELQDTLRLGQLITVPFGNRKTWGIVWKLKDKVEESKFKIKKIDSIRIEKEVFSQEQRVFAEWLCDRYFYPIGEVCETMLPAAIRKASQKLLLQKATKKNVSIDPQPLRILNQGQSQAIEDINSSALLEHLLWGVTGSGKTEVYLHLIEKKLQESKGSIVLVPEIALTPQLFSRFEKAFPGKIAVFHSAQSEKEQRTAWLEVFSGEKKIAIGPRSALFAPVQNLGLIIMDE